MQLHSENRRASRVTVVTHSHTPPQARSAGVLDAVEGKTHIVHMGMLLEKMENQLREHMEAVYIGKTHAITSTLHKYGDGKKKKLTGMT